jgi:hypothetical protein
MQRGGTRWRSIFHMRRRSLMKGVPLSEEATFFSESIALLSESTARASSGRKDGGEVAVEVSVESPTMSAYCYGNQREKFSFSFAHVKKKLTLIRCHFPWLAILLSGNI